MLEDKSQLCYSYCDIRGTVEREGYVPSRKPGLLILMRTRKAQLISQFTQSFQSQSVVVKEDYCATGAVASVCSMPTYETKAAWTTAC